MLSPLVKCVTSFTVNSATEITAVVGSTTGQIAVTAGSQTGTSSNSLTVNANPTAVTVSAGSVCSGSSTNLTASGGSGGTIYWQGTSSGGTQDLINSGSTSPAYSSAGTYYANAVSSAGCWGTEGSAVLTVNDFTSNVSASARAAGVCSGGSVNLTGSATSPSNSGTMGTTEYTGYAEKTFLSLLSMKMQDRIPLSCIDLNAAGISGGPT